MAGRICENETALKIKHRLKHRQNFFVRNTVDEFDVSHFRGQYQSNIPLLGFLVASHQLKKLLRIQSRIQLDWQLELPEQSRLPLCHFRIYPAEIHRQICCAAHAHRDGFTVQVLFILRCRFDRMAERVTVIQYRATPGSFALIFLDHVGLNLTTSRNDVL